MTLEHPTLVRIEYWNPMTAAWETGHAGINLLHPDAYIHKLAKRGVISRAVEVDTGVTVYSEGADLL